MSPGSPDRRAAPAAEALATALAAELGRAVREVRQRRRWSARTLAVRARVARASVTNVEAGRRASLDVYARLAAALGVSLEIILGDRARRTTHQTIDLVHSAMGELEARLLRAHGFDVAIDHPYQHYQFAGRADVLAWTRRPVALLHIENRTRFPDLQSAAGSYNAKREYLATVVARQLGVRRFESETHVMVGLWSAEVIHSVRLRPATFQALCPDPADRLSAWLRGGPPPPGASSSFVLLDPTASGRQARLIDLDRVLAGVRPRSHDYRDAAEKLRALRLT